jgi:hypothetical protein
MLAELAMNAAALRSLAPMHEGVIAADVPASTAFAPLLSAAVLRPCRGDSIGKMHSSEAGDRAFALV